MNPKRCIPVAGRLLACGWMLVWLAGWQLQAQPAYARYRAGRGPGDPGVLRIYAADRPDPVLIAAERGQADGFVWWIYGPSGGELRLDLAERTGSVYAGQQAFGFWRAEPGSWRLEGARDTARLVFGGTDPAAWGRLELLRGSAAVPLIRYERPVRAGKLRARYTGLLADYPEALAWTAWLLAAREAERLPGADGQPRR